MSQFKEKKPVLILGGTGKTGSRVAAQLQDRGLAVRVASRSSDAYFDWNDTTSWAPVLEGVSAVYITYQPDLAVPGAVEAVRSFTELALKAGVRRIILLSGRGEEEAQRAEQVLQGSGADWTIVRASWFAQNFSESFLYDAVLSGDVALPLGEIKEPFVDADDIADVVVAAITDAAHIGQEYELTGPRLISFTDVIAEIAEASGRPITYRKIPIEDYAAFLEKNELPPEYVSLVLYLFTTVMDGRNEYLTDGVKRALGREPRDFTEYVRKTAATGVWGL